MINQTLNNAEIYLHCIDSQHILIYLPLTGYASVGTEQIVSEMETLVTNPDAQVSEHSREIYSHLCDKPRPIYHKLADSSELLNMMILPNSKCNFHCTYCYSAYGRSGKEISPDKLKYAIDFFFEKGRAENKRLTISVLGGGEPLLSWDLLKPALLHAIDLSERNGRKLPLSIVTNGSIINVDIVQFILKHNVSLSVSFDILEEIQNKQRGQYRKVMANINHFAENGVDVVLNTVITIDNVNRMVEMIENMGNTMPLVKKVSFKPIISSDYFSDTQERQEYYDAFVTNFYKALDIASEKHIFLTSPYYNNASCLSNRYCPGKFVVTAEGTVSICHTVSSERDKAYDQFIYGHINDDGTLTIDEDKLAKILSHDYNSRESCKSCIARWHCAGGCYADNCSINDDAKEAYCRSMQSFMKEFLLRKYNLNV